MVYRALVALLLQAMALLLPAMAHAAPTNIAAELIVENSAAPGETVDLALLMRPAPGWHGYWQNPGDAGLGMQLEWTLPKSAVIGTPRYPVPETLLIQGLMNHVYGHDHAVLVGFTVPRDAQAGAVLPVTVSAQWLACTDAICVPERGTFSANVTVGAGGAHDARFDAWRQKLAAPLGAEARMAYDAKHLRLAIPLPASVAMRDPHLFLSEDKVIDYAAPQRFSRSGDLLVIEIPRAKFAATSPERVNGVLRLGREGDLGLAFTAAPGNVPAATPATGGFLWLLLGAVVGGLLLNVMPCVFPILSLKALSLARAGESEGGARAEGLAYTAGVMLACLALGGVLLALRAGGEEVGWAFQLQEPLVVAGLTLLATAITANLAGVFEFAVPGFASHGSPKGAFATGLLAAFVATPCTGPFMAAAMGAALLLPPAPALALFAALGLGLALPFLALAFVPPLRRLLPRPGPWMVWFRKLMALPMGLTALALLWLAWRLGGWFFAGVWAAIAMAILVQLWLAGEKQRSGLGVGKLLWIEIIGLIGVGVIAAPHILAAPHAADAGLLGAKPFSDAAVAEGRRSGKPVFVYFTADWCLTCKVNEAAAIDREETRAAFEKAGVIVLVGDWTRRDPAITRFLTAHGAAGVPLYLWYAPGAGAAEQLPQVLGPATLPDFARRN